MQRPRRCPKCGELQTKPVDVGDDPWLPLVRQWVTERTSTTIAEVLAGLHITPSRAAEIRIGRALRWYGFEKQRVWRGKTRVHVYARLTAARV